MDKPKQIKDCGLCGARGTVKLVQAKQIITIKDRSHNGKWWKYECSGCGKSFTTTESDSISYKLFKEQQAAREKKLNREEQ